MVWDSFRFLVEQLLGEGFYGYGFRGRCKESKGTF